VAATIVRDFVQALTQEIEAINRGKGGSVTKVFHGRFLRQSAGLYVYLFHLESFLSLLDEAPAEIEIGGNRYKAQVLITQGLEVEIGIEHFCGQAVAEARLHTKLWYLLELLKKKYEEFLTGSSKADFSMSEMLFSGDHFKLKNVPHSGPVFSVSKDPPNDAQKKAIIDSFSFPLSVIWGPPGTGKTKTIANAVEAHLKAGRRSSWFLMPTTPLTKRWKM